MLAGTAAANPAVYFTEDMALGRQTFIDTAAAADAAYNAANAGATQSSRIHEFDMTRTSGAAFFVTDPTTQANIYIQTTLAGSLAQNSANGDLGGDGFTNWDVDYIPGDWNSVVAAGYTVSFFTDAAHTNAYMMNALGLNVSDWGTCCAAGNTRPDGSAVNASEIYMLFDGSTPLLVGGISNTIGRTEHFVAAIDDRNAFSSVTLVPNGYGEAFGAGGKLIFSTLALNSVPAGSSLVTVGTPPPVTPTIDTNTSYTPDQIADGAVDPTFNGGTLLFVTDTEVTADVAIGAGGGTIDTMAGDATISGDIADDSGANGALVKTGTGTLILTGTNTYSGGTTVLQGTLQGDSDALQGDIANSATVDFAQATGGTYADTLSGIGTLVKSGGGTLTVTGAQTFTGDTIIEDGTLALAGNGSLAGTGRVVADGTFDIADTDNGAAVRSLAGNGAVALGDQTLTLTGASDSFDGSIGGTGGLAVNGGTLTLTGANSFTGRLAIGAATVRVGSDGALGDGPITIGAGTLQATSGFDSGKAILVTSAASTVDTAAFDVALAGLLSGPGTLNKIGSGMLTLSGTNSQNGLNVSEGSVLLLSAAAAGATNGDIVLHRDTSFLAGADMTLSQHLRVEGANALFDTGAHSVVLTGTGTGNDCLIKAGSGRLTLAAETSNAIGACIRQGTLSFNSVFTGQVWVEQDGIASGSGLVRGDMDVRGVLAPGNSPGRLEVQGSVTQGATGTLALDIDGTTPGNGAGHYDTLVLTGAGSVYTAGGTLAPQLRGITGDATNAYTPEIGATFEVVTAEGGVTGAFTALTQPSAGLAAGSRFEVFYLPNAVRLAVAAESYGELMAGVGSSNAAAVGYAVDATRGTTFAGGTTDADLLGQGLLGQGATQLSRTLQQAAGEIHADGMDVVVQAGRASRASILQHMEGEPAGRIWGAAWTESAKVNGDSHARGYDADVDSYLIGMDGELAPGIVLGGAFGYARSRALTEFVGISAADSFQGLLYGSGTRGATYVTGIVSASVDRYETDRQVDLSTGAARLTSRPDGMSWGGELEIGHRFDLGAARFVPSLGIAYDGIDRDRFVERGDAYAALTFDKESRNAVIGRVGGRLSVPVGAFMPYVSAAVTHEFADLSTQLSPELNGTRFTIVAPEPGRTALRLGAGATAALGQAVSLRVGYRFVGLNDAEGHVVNGALSIAF